MFFEIIIIQPLIVIVLVGGEDFYYVFQVFAFLGTTLSRIFRTRNRTIRATGIIGSILFDYRTSNATNPWKHR